MALPVTAVGVVVVGIGYSVLRNNHEMSEWRGKFYDASTIEDAEMIDQGSRFGLQPGTNGDHCDREAWLVYRTDLEPSVVLAHLAPLIDPADGELSATAGSEPGTVRVDYWYRFEDGGWDIRCT